MAKTLYAWSPILAGEKSIELGESVTAADVGGTEERDRLVAAGVLRAKEYPEAAKGGGIAPNEVRLREIRKELEEMGISIEEVMAEAAREADIATPAEEI